MRIACCIVLALVFSADRQAWACSCVPSSPCAQFNGVDAVFLGRVMDIRLEGNVNRVRMEVIRTYKGAVEEQVTVSNEAGNSCSFTFLIGQRFLVFGSGSRQTFSTQMCAGGGPLRPGEPEPDLPPPGGHVDGQLVNVNPNFTSSRDAFSPAAGVRIWVDTATGAIETKTDASGRFRLYAVPAGPHVVRADVGPTLEGIAQVNLRSSSDCATVAIITRASGRIAGQLRSEVAAVDGAEVVAVPVDDSASRGLGRTARAKANADGFFELTGLEMGKYYVTVNVVTGPTVKHPFAPTYYPGVATREESVAVDVGQSPVLPRGPFILARTVPRTTITVEIVCEDGSSPRSGSVLATPADGRAFAIESTYKMVDGRFQLPVIAGVPYDVKGSVGVPQRNADGRETSVLLVNVPSVRVEPGSTSVARLVAPLKRCDEITRD